MHEAWPNAHHRAPPDLAIRQRRLCSGARPSAQPYVACRDEIGIASDRFKSGNDRNASPGELDFMLGGMTRRMKAHVSAMLTEKRFEYCTVAASLQGIGATGSRAQADKHGLRGAFRLDNAECGQRRRQWPCYSPTLHILPKMPTMDAKWH